VTRVQKDYILVSRFGAAVDIGGNPAKDLATAVFAVRLQS